MSKTIILSGMSSTMGVSPTDRANAVIIASSSSPPVPVEKATVWSKRSSSGRGAGWANTGTAPSNRAHVMRESTRFMVTA